MDESEPSKLRRLSLNASKKNEPHSPTFAHLRPPSPTFAQKSLCEKIERMRRKVIGRLQKWLGKMAEPEIMQDFDRVDSYSQTGEDMILRHYLDPRQPGFFVDVGAHHPTRFSNTYFFYKYGWRGINIDAMPGSMDAFRAVRPRDINIEMGVADTEGELTFYTFSDPELNTFVEEFARQHNARGYPTLSATRVKTAPLAQILNANVPANQTIDFLSVDVEGFEEATLNTNDWTRYRPRFILIEAHLFNIAQPEQDPTYRFLHDRGYAALARTNFTLILGAQ